MLKEFRQAVLFTVTTMVLLGGTYHLVLWEIGRTLFADQSEGSLVRRGNGTIAGARLIAQAFRRPEYFRPRPSATGYNAASTGGSNYGPSNPDHLKAVRQRIDVIVAEDHVPPGEIPSEMVTTSGAGLDPHIPPAGAELQATRVASARGVSIARVRALVRAHTEPATFGLFGRARVNVLELNLALDQTLGAPAGAER